MHQLLLISSLFLSSLCLAAGTIYQTVGPDGSIVFTDQPSKGAKEIKLKPITTYNAKEASGANKKADLGLSNDPDPDKSTHYKTFTITGPADDTTLQTGVAGNTTIQSKIDPPLRIKNGHRLSALIDGTQLDYSTSANSIGLRNLERGTHSIRTVIVNERGDIVQLSSNSVTIHVKRASVFAPSNPRNPNTNRPPVAAP
ncbi:MAG: DUF4124 domain-containing protein [Thiotrichales bacterium]|nr:DUF4124 domain-containing protein [Thiotrichales bacterium]